MSVLSTTGGLTAVGNDGKTFRPKESPYLGTVKFNFVVFGVFVATVALERSFDNGATWLPVYDTAGNAISTTAPKGYIIDEPEDSVLYRVNCTAYTSGTANYRLSR